MKTILSFTDSVNESGWHRLMRTVVLCLCQDLRNNSSISNNKNQICIMWLVITETNLSALLFISQNLREKHFCWKHIPQIFHIMYRNIKSVMRTSVLYKVHAIMDLNEILVLPKLPKRKTESFVLIQCLTFNMFLTCV